MILEKFFRFASRAERVHVGLRVGRPSGNANGDDACTKRTFDGKGDRSIWPGRRFFSFLSFEAEFLGFSPSLPLPQCRRCRFRPPPRFLMQFVSGTHGEGRGGGGDRDRRLSEMREGESVGRLLIWASILLTRKEPPPPNSDSPPSFPPFAAELAVEG